ncbi:hypothetical protein H4S02_003350 [Coemansia sp. RSA 2611]|nr:hypothetical protein H4S02_003350 [Coemansia sp. RSA 2611]
MAELDVANLSKLKVADLRKELSKRNLSTTGVKDVLIQRLTDALEQPEEDNAAAAEDDQIDLLPTDEQGDVESHGDADAAAAADANQHTLVNEDDGLNNGMEVEGAAENGDSDCKRRLSEGAPMDTSDEQNGAEATPVNAHMGTAEDSLFIKNLERPLTIFRVKELLGPFGTVEDIWLNSIKTRAYVRFAARAEAEAAFAGINGTQFPPEHGKILECGFITQARMKELVNEEESRSDEVHSLDLVAVPADSTNCSIALVGTQGKGKSAAKRQRTDKAAEDKKPDLAASQSASLIIAAASAAASDAKNADKRGEKRAERGASPNGAAAKDDGLTRWTKEQPSVSFRPRTDAEVAARKATAPAQD